MNQYFLSWYRNESAVLRLVTENIHTSLKLTLKYVKIVRPVATEDTFSGYESSK